MADQSQYWQQQQGAWPPQQQPPAWPSQPPPGGAQPPGTGSEAAPAPKAPTPLDPPAVYYNTTWRVPPLVVDTQEAADALDPNEWTTGAPPAAPGAAGQADKPQWPQLYYNVNVSPRIVNDAKEAKSLGDEWQAFNLPDGLCKAAEANNAAKAKAAAAKAQSQSQSQAQGQQQSQQQSQAPGYPQGG